MVLTTLHHFTKIYLDL